MWGFSYAGGHAIYTAADDHKLAAAVGLCPMTDVIAFMRSMPARIERGVTDQIEFLSRHLRAG